MEFKFYICPKCKKIIAVVKDTPVPTMCCGEKMVEIVPNTSDGAREKHVPVIKVEGTKVTVTVGEVMHPMTEAHYIEWIGIQTKNCNQRKVLLPTDKPEAVFYIAEDDEVKCAFAYCNLHSLFMTK